ncbi:hypothetical protein C5167_012732 [Papaver somniferum]|uniref:Uncharacterized protein n=1 Tax=Papaver somniferum TaxID=3469 RepID=A0A4Y7J2A7_PAPSO|nr:hypothetical protein C5167_012732 [Papaver somniferum]
MLCTIFFTNCGGEYINFKYLNCVLSFENMAKHSWPDLVCEWLVENLNDQYEKPFSVTGCTPAIWVSFSKLWTLDAF